MNATTTGNAELKKIWGALKSREKGRKLAKGGDRTEWMIDRRLRHVLGRR